MTRLSTASAATASGLRAARADPHGGVLLTSKLASPDLAHATVSRHRLLNQLTLDVQRSLITLVSGPAGSGKTVLAASWRQSQGRDEPIGWLTLDYYDDDPATFWSYVVQVLSGVGVDAGDVPGLTTGEPPPEWLIPRLASTVASRPRPVVLIIDNADNLTDRSIVAGLDLLVRQAGGHLRLVLCARADPLLPLHRYQLAGTLSEIRTAQLSFTPDETRQLLSAMDVHVSQEVASVLCAETQGWAVGLRLAAAPLKQGVLPGRLVTSLAQDDGSVAQYLFAEVLEGQPASVRSVLLRTSVTEELWPDLVDRLCGRGNVRRVLAGLAHANAFVEESLGAPGGFRIHPVFREMLQAQLGYEQPEELTRLHRVCAAWYAERGRPLDAVGHAVAGADWGFVTRLLIDDLLVVRLLVHGSDPALRGLEELPPDQSGPEAAVIRVVTALARGDHPALADVATSAAAQSEGDRLALRISGGLACLAAGEPDVVPADMLARVDEVAALVAELPDEDVRARRECAAVLSDQRARATLRTDAATEQLLTSLRSASAAAQSAGSRRLRCRSVSNLALVEALEGNLTRAAQLAAEAEAFATESGVEEDKREPSAATALAWVHLRRYALVEARDWLVRARARERTAGPGTVGTEPLEAVLRSQQFRLRHEYDLAESVLRPHLQGPRLPRWVSEHVISETVRLAVARGHVAEGLQILRDRGRDEPWSLRLRTTAHLLAGEPATDPTAPAEPSTSLAHQVESAVIDACQLLEAGRGPAAAEALADALALARPELLRWPFVETPPQARRLLRTHPDLRDPGAWLNPSTGAVPRPRVDRVPADAGEHVLVQDLSERETEVLRYLAEMLSTAEIAATMFISVNTVRTHIRSILRKLAVSRRNQAVRRARERGLL